MIDCAGGVYSRYVYGNSFTKPSNLFQHLPGFSHNYLKGNLVFISRLINMQWVMNAFESAVKSIAMVILIIGAGGVLKQTIIDTGIGDTIGMLMSHGNISPYIMAWLITVLIRLATGQGVVSAMTAAGIISAAILDPATGQLVGVNPALLVLATAAGSNTLTHINDASFWLFKGYFDLSVKDTLKTWGLLELVNSVVGLIIVLIISMVA
ncbi:TRAP transporter large permease subunit [Escherichia coli]|uniref:GntT/GntP/DsdX family permease n=1 Tax=Escherichia coli TaxID=562 RepID=UPI00237B6B52|nr:TRAP transporter large permease subunit [Escherichia coli]